MAWVCISTEWPPSSSCLFVDVGIALTWLAMAVPFSNTKLRPPRGLRNILEGLSREVLRCQPGDIYAFGSLYFDRLLRIRHGQITLHINSYIHMQGHKPRGRDDVPPPQFGVWDGYAIRPHIFTLTRLIKRQVGPLLCDHNTLETHQTTSVFVWGFCTDLMLMEVTVLHTH